MASMGLALEARIRPPGQIMAKIIAGIEPTIVIEVDPELSGDNLIVAAVESTGFTPSQLSSLLHFVADAIDESVKEDAIYPALDDGDGNELVPKEVHRAREEMAAKIAERKKQEEEPDPFDGDAPGSRL